MAERYTSTSGQIVSGGSFALGTIIDGYLTDEQAAFLYKNWRVDWPEKLVFSGSIEAITCEMIQEVGEAAFCSYRKKADREMAVAVWNIANRNAGR